MADKPKQGFQKGHARLGGRTKGTPNKLNRDMREMLFQALEAEGGVEYLRWASREKPAAFLALVGKLLPPEEYYPRLPATNIRFNIGFPQPPIDYGEPPKLRDGKLIDVTPQPVRSSDAE